jgi:hypothetical protein
MKAYVINEKARRKETTRKSKLYMVDFAEIGLSIMEWIYLTQDRDRWRAVVNAVMNTFRFHKILRNNCATCGCQVVVSPIEIDM